MSLSRERNTPMLGDGLVREIGVKANVVIYNGALVVQDAGLAAPGRVAVGLVALGVAESTVDNTGGADGAKRVRIKRGVRGLKNLTADAITAADVNKDCYVYDDETVAKTSGGGARSVAGRVFSLDGDTVYVDFL